MDNYFESILLEAILRCNGHYIDKSRNGFSRLYPFTTENIFGYIKNFNLENSSLYQPSKTHLLRWVFGKVPYFFTISYIF